ncbi:MAG: glycosyltransferase family 4 protein [Chitinophagaceae bacterium]
MSTRKQILFLTLKIFSAEGGIEKVCKIAGKALYELFPESVSIFSMYDKQGDVDPKYFPSSAFGGFAAQKLKTIYSSIKEGIKSKVVIISHINLLPVGYLIKKVSPQTKLVLFAHGIEVWQSLSVLKLKMLRKVDSILAVSNYTKNTMLNLYKLDTANVQVLNNCLDPFLPTLINAEEKLVLYKKYNLSESDFILITVTRIAADEQYKGHEKIIESMSSLIEEFPNIRYLIVGNYDQSEKKRLDRLINNYNLKANITFTGFIPDDELAAHYKLADLYVMPSKGEGFGIVFIEAMFYGLPVIAGNTDGSVDPLCNGKLGQLINPDDAIELTAAIKRVIKNSVAFKPDVNLLMQNFSYPIYKKNLKEAVEIL